MRTRKCLNVSFLVRMQIFFIEQVFSSVIQLADILKFGLDKLFDSEER